MDSLIGWNLKESKLYGGVVADIVIEKFCGLDLIGCTRDKTGEPWKVDLISENDGLGEEVRAVAMAAIEIDLRV